MASRKPSGEISQKDSVLAALPEEKEQLAESLRTAILSEDRSLSDTIHKSAKPDPKPTRKKTKSAQRKKTTKPAAKPKSQKKKIPSQKRASRPAARQKARSNRRRAK